MLTKTISPTLFLGSVAFAVLISFLLITTVSANPLYFPVASNVTATTSVTYFTTGTATTTLTTLDAYASTSGRAADNSVLLIQMAASSTSSVLQGKVEYSQDGIDWYDNDIFTKTSVGIV